MDEALTWFLDSGPWAEGRQTSVLLPNGQFVARPVRYFEPDGEREQLMFNLQGTGLFPEVRAQLLALAQDNPQGTLFISETETREEDGTHSEVLHLFIRDGGGAVWCNDSVIVHLSYERDRLTPELDGLIAFRRAHSRPFRS